VCTARAKGWEGDDVIASLALDYFDDLPVTIMSSDRDFTQVMTDDDRVRLWDPLKGHWVHKDRWHWLDRLMDPKKADGLIGVSGIGESWAAKLRNLWLDAVGDENAMAERPRVDQLESFISHFVGLCDGNSAAPKKHQAVVAEQQKLRANLRCTDLLSVVEPCSEHLVFRDGCLDRRRFRARCAKLGIRPLIQDFSSVWPVFARLEVLI